MVYSSERGSENKIGSNEGEDPENRAKSERNIYVIISSHMLIMLISLITSLAQRERGV